MNIIRRIIYSIAFLLLSVVSKAQTADKVEMADILHQNGKIYLVVLVLVTIFAGIIFLLLRVENKLNRLEKKEEKKLKMEN